MNSGSLTKMSPIHYVNDHYRYYFATESSTLKISLSYGHDPLAADILIRIGSPAAQKIGCKKIMLRQESKVRYDGLRVDEECCYIGPRQSVNPF